LGAHQFDEKGLGLADGDMLRPVERTRKYLWIRRFTDGARPERVVRLEGSAETGDDLPVWSADGKLEIETSINITRI
jgi:hypothetical protein